MPNGELMTSAVVCEILGGIHRSTLIRWVDAGKIAARKLPGQTNTYLFEPDEVERVRAEMAAAGQAKAAAAP